MSDKRIERFLSVFSLSVQNEILDFCRRISSQKADIYIFLARKAAAFCDCLEELGQIHLDGYVTTDRSLDIGGEWICGKKVVLVDDAVVSGTTIYSTIQKLKQLGAESITVHILTVNHQWFQPELLKESKTADYLYPVYNRLPDSDCIKLCNDIVQAISLIPRPYDVDFPLYKSFTTTEHCLQSILVLNGWYCYDIRTISQKENDIINFTMIPDSTELSELSRVFGLNIQKNNIVKIRIYGRPTGKKKERYSLRIAPIVVFQEADTEKIECIFESITSFSNDPFCFDGWCDSAKLRFLQFYFSNLLGRYWFYRVKHILKIETVPDFSYRNLSFLFPSHCISAIKELCNMIVKAPCEISASLAPSRDRTTSSRYDSVDPISLNARLYEPFLQMYHSKELPCRRLVKKKGQTVFESPAHSDLLNRLNEGLSFQDLVERLEDCRDIIDIEQYVSIFIDKAIDAGIIVPIVQVKDHTVFRAYRHGEDVLFGHREDIMYRKMLSLFANYSGSGGSITRIETEKLLVLFSKIGMKTKILHPYTSDFTDIPYSSTGEAMKILRIKPYLKGPISLLGTPLQHQETKNIPFVTNERKSLWLTRSMLKADSLRSGNNNRKYFVTPLDETSENDYNSLTLQEKNFVEDFAELTGRISNPNCDTGVDFSETDWTKISITLTLPDTITAVAAEMELFYREFDISPLCSFSDNQEQELASIKHFVASYAYESIHSAVMKIESFTSKKGQELISSVRFPSNVEQRTWLAFFSDELRDQSEHSNALLASVFYDQKVWAYLMRVLVDSVFLFSQLRYNKRYHSRNANRKRISEARNRVKMSCDELDRLKAATPKNAISASHFFSVYDSLHSQFVALYTGEDATLDGFLSQIIAAIDMTESYATSIQELVCSMLGEHGKVNDVRLYNYAVHIKVINCPQERLFLADEKIEQALKKELEKIAKDKAFAVSKGKPVPVFDIEALPQIHKPLPKEGEEPGYWFIAHGSRNELPISSIVDRVASFSMNVYDCLVKNGIDCRVTVFDRLPYEAAVRGGMSRFHSLHCNQFNVFMRRFKDKVLFPEDRHPALVHVQPKTTDTTRSILNAITGSGVFVEYDSFLISDPENPDYSVSCFKHKTAPLLKQINAPDFGIITVLKEELQAITKTFQMNQLPSAFGERVYYHGIVKAENSTKKRDVVCTQTLNQGEVATANAFHEMVSKYHPKIVFLIGIAGGIRKLTVDGSNSRPVFDLCDVVIARSVLDYEMRKETESGVEHRGNIYEINASCAAAVNAFLVAYGDNITPSPNSLHKDLNIFFEPIGSGNAVIANELSTIVEWLKHVNSKVIAVEMEATGISSAAKERLSDTSVKGVIVIRGISDFADIKKDKSAPFRVPAAVNAAIVAKELMSSFPKL